MKTPFDHHDAERPLVTVQLMTHPGHLPWLERAVRSVLAQDLPHALLELQVVHDGPDSDPTVALLEQLEPELDFPLSFVGTPVAYGYYCAPRNQALPFARGAYVAHLDADNEWRPGHLSGLLAAIRTPHGDAGWPHFVYSRREYVEDAEGVAPATPEGPCLGPSPLVEWEHDALQAMINNPQRNFLDTSDFLIGRSVLYELAERSQCVWNVECRRMADWDLAKRLALNGLRGRAVDQVTHIYHWTGDNIQLTRSIVPGNTVAIPEAVYERMLREGKIRPQAAAEAAE